MSRFDAAPCIVPLTLLALLACPLARAIAAEPAGAATLVPVPESVRPRIPPPRTRAEVQATLQGADEKAHTRPIQVVLVAGRKDHGPGEHDYPAWQKAWAKLLARAQQARVTTAWETPSARDFETADVMVVFKHTAWPKGLNEAVDAYFARGGGMVVLHYAVDAGNNREAVGKRLGLCWGRGSKFRHGPVDLVFDAKCSDPITRNFAGKTVHFHDETYWRLHGDPSGIQVLATGIEKGEDKPIPLLWNRQTGKGRVHVNILGHYNWTFNDPLFRILVLRAVAWAAGEPVDRFNGLVTVGVPLRD